MNKGEALRDGEREEGEQSIIWQNWQRGKVTEVGKKRKFPGKLFDQLMPKTILEWKFVNKKRKKRGKNDKNRENSKKGKENRGV